MSQISVLVCSRGRPSGLQRMLESMYDKATDPTALQVYIRLDDDDKCLEDYARIKYDWTGFRDYKIGPCKGNIAPYNGLMDSGFADPAVIASIIMADDAIFKTDGWDETIRCFDEMDASKLYLLHYRDGIANSLCASFPIVSRNLYRFFGNVFDEDFKSMKVDQTLTDICRDAGVCRYIQDHFIEHLHPKVGKAELDEIYMRNRDQYQIHTDTELFNSPAKVQQRKEMAAKLIQEVNKWR